MPRTLTGIVITALLFVCARLADAAGTGAGAAMFRADAQRSGVYLAAAGSAYGGLAWAVRTNGSIHGSPVVAGGVVYAGSSDGGLYAFGLRDGRLLWRTELGDAAAGTPALAGGRLYLQTLTGRLVAARASDGRIVWSRNLGPPARLAWGFESGDYYASSAALAGGSIVIGGADGALYRLRAADGAVQWRFATGGRVRSSPAISGDTAYVGSFDGFVYAVDLARGRERWRHATNGAALDSGHFGYDRRSVQSSPAVADGVVAVGARDGWLYGLDAASGKRLWEFDNALFWVNSSPAIRDGRAYAGNSDARMLQCVDLHSGREIWRFPTKSNVFASPALAGDTAFITDFTGRLYAVSLATGQQRWEVSFDGARSVSSPVVSGDRVIFGTDDGWLYAVRLVTAARALHRAVYFEDRDAKLGSIASGPWLRDAFTRRAYEKLGAAGLAAFMRARIADRAPSVIVFALDDLPNETRDPDGTPSLVRAYLDAGGKIVWPGVPPFLAPIDRTTGEGSIAGIDRRAARRLLDVDFGPGNFDPLTMSPTQAGVRWGLRGWFTGRWSSAATGTEVLAFDENHNAGAWVRRYGGADGTGFVRIPAVETGTVAVNLTALAIAADYRPSD